MQLKRKLCASGHIAVRGPPGANNRAGTHGSTAPRLHLATRAYQLADDIPVVDFGQAAHAGLTPAESLNERGPAYRAPERASLTMRSNPRSGMWGGGRLAGDSIGSNGIARMCELHHTFAT